MCTLLGMGPREQATVERLKAASLASDASLRASVEGIDSISDGDRWDLVFRMLQALSETCVELAREVDHLRS